MNKILKYSLIIIMCLSLVTNLWLLMIIGYVANEYEDEIYLEGLEWCEYTNDLSYLVNDLIDTLAYYDSNYQDTERLSSSDCWNTELDK